jgi:predicted RNase H-like HicB family nuclease
MKTPRSPRPLPRTEPLQLGCLAAAATRDEVERAVREAIAFHLDGLRANGLPIPAGVTTATYVDVAA